MKSGWMLDVASTSQRLAKGVGSRLTVALYDVDGAWLALRQTGSPLDEN